MGSGDALPVLSLHHISRVCRCLSATRDFYKHRLGFFEVKRPKNFDCEGSWLFGYGIGLHLLEGTPVYRPPEIHPSRDHISFVAKNLDEIAENLQKNGVCIYRDAVNESGTVITQIFFHDPDNNMIEICNCDCLPIIRVESDATISENVVEPTEHTLLTAHGAMDSTHTDSDFSTSHMSQMDDWSRMFPSTPNIEVLAISDAANMKSVPESRGSFASSYMSHSPREHM